MHRLFVAIRPPDPICDQLVDAMDEGPQLRWVPADNLHLTLRFIGEVERPLAEDIATALGRVHAPQLELSLVGVGRFDRRNGGALWAAVQPKEAIAALAARIERACQGVGLPPERRSFHPHITLARFGREGAQHAVTFVQRARGLASPLFTADHFTFYECHLSRHGAHYDEIARYALG